MDETTNKANELDLDSSNNIGEDVIFSSGPLIDSKIHPYAEVITMDPDPEQLPPKVDGHALPAGLIKPKT